MTPTTQVTRSQTRADAPSAAWTLSGILAGILALDVAHRQKRRVMSMDAHLLDDAGMTEDDRDLIGRTPVWKTPAFHIERDRIRDALTRRR